MVVIKENATLGNVFAAFFSFETLAPFLVFDGLLDQTTAIAHTHFAIANK